LLTLAKSSSRGILSSSNASFKNTSGSDYSTLRILLHITLRSMPQLNINNDLRFYLVVFSDATEY